MGDHILLLRHLTGPVYNLNDLHYRKKMYNQEHVAEQ